MWTNCITPRELELAQPTKQTREPLQNLLQPGHTAQILTLRDPVNHPINRMGNRMAVFPTLSPYLWTFDYTLRSDGRPGIRMLFDAPSQQYVPPSPFEIEQALGRPVGYTAHGRITDAMRAFHLGHMMDGRLIMFLAEILQGTKP